jgi:hypothetical protein
MDSGQSRQTDALALLAAGPCGYQAESAPAAEPTALAVMALAGAGRAEQAVPHLEWLAANQTSAGLSPPFSALEQPGWPTAMAILASALVARCRRDLQVPDDPLATNSNQRTSRFDLERATQWLIAAEGSSAKKSPEFGHNARLVGWPWVVGTHSWQEPTAWSVLALKAQGRSEHSRTREGVQLLVDRLLDVGGCNYGNTVVLRQKLRPHIEPTGLTLVALAGETIDDPRIRRSCQYLESAITDETPPISLSYGLLGLTAQGRTPTNVDRRLNAAFDDALRRNRSPLALALLSLAAQQKDCPLIKFTTA